jgi:hypothetical protein
MIPRTIPPSSKRDTHIRSTDVLDALGWQTLDHDVKRLENKLMMYKLPLI